MHWAPVRTDVGVQWVRADEGAGREEVEDRELALMGGAERLL